MLRLILCTALFATVGSWAGDVDYKVDGQDYEGYALKKSKSAPTVLLLHDWDGLTGYEKKRAKMIKKLGYSVFGSERYREGPDKLSWRRFAHFLKDVK